MCSQNTEPGLAWGCSYPADLVLGMPQPWARLLLLWELRNDPVLFAKVPQFWLFPPLQSAEIFCFLLIPSISRFWVKTSPFLWGAGGSSSCSIPVLHENDSNNNNNSDKGFRQRLKEQIYGFFWPASILGAVCAGPPLGDGAQPRVGGDPWPGWCLCCCPCPIPGSLDIPGHFQPSCGSSALSVCSWLSRRHLELRGRECGWRNINMPRANPPH